MTKNPLSVELLQLPPSARPFSARYDEDSDVLLIENAQPLDWPHGATLDALLTIDLNNARELAHVELMWAKTKWPRGEARIPHAAMMPAIVRLPVLGTEPLAVLPPVSVIASVEYVVVQIGVPREAARMPLGPGVDALIGSGVLQGFVVDNLLLART